MPTQSMVLQTADTLPPQMVNLPQRTVLFLLTKHLFMGLNSLLKMQNFKRKRKGRKSARL